MTDGERRGLRPDHLLIVVDEADDLPSLEALRRLGREVLADAVPAVAAGLSGTLGLGTRFELRYDTSPLIERLDRLIVTDPEARARYERLLEEWARGLKFRPLRPFGLYLGPLPRPWKASQARRYRRRR